MIMCVQVHAYILETYTILKFQNKIYFLILTQEAYLNEQRTGENMRHCSSQVCILNIKIIISPVFT